ncbi:MAG: hypothetical protein IJB11_08610 [Oscillospiraceae bacterium]|nr:hypothetical protein [Oscillospiraceae bacterium]
MSATGYIQVYAYTSRARIPLKDVAVTVTAADGTAIGMRLTDRNGKIDPIPVPVPNLSESQQPNPPELPFTQVNLLARLKDYVTIESENLQVFANTTTDQNLEMVPLAELPDSWAQEEIFQTPVQNL